MRSRGFTAVELLVVIIIMAILLMLAVVNVRSTQISARDNDRNVDVESIGLALESYYNADHSGYTKTYPGTSDLVDGQDAMTYLKEHVHDNSLRAPGVNSGDPISLVRATNNQGASGVTPAPTIKTYVYQPITNSGALCGSYQSPCRKFFIYYKLESATADCPASANVCTYMSKNQ